MFLCFTDLSIDTLTLYVYNRLISQSPQCTSSISHNVPFRTEMCTCNTVSCVSLSYRTHAINRPSLRWRHNDHAGVSNHQPHGCLLNRLFRRKSKKTSKLRVTGLCAGNSPGTGEFPAQMASYAENVSIWWRHHDAETGLSATEMPTSI